MYTTNILRTILPLICYNCISKYESFHNNLLTETGIKQIHTLALLLQERGVQYVRARQTAKILGKDLGVDTSLMDREFITTRKGRSLRSGRKD